jgi:localization factor PodJL
MSANAPWSVKGIDPKAREIAKDLARKQGKTLGEWLNEKIIEGGLEGEAGPRDREPEMGDSDPYREIMQDLGRHAARETERREGDRREVYSDRRDGDRREAERRARPTASLYPEPIRRSRFDEDYSPGEDELSRVTRALDRLSARIEAAENRSTVAISGIDQSVVGVLSRMETVERDNNSLAARFEGAVEDVRATQRSVAERLQRLEQSDEGPRQAEAMRALEAALGKIAGQLYEGEQRTTHALGELKETVRDELSQNEIRTRASISSVREEIADSEQRTRAAFGVMRDDMMERDTRTQSAFEGLAQVVTQADQNSRETARQLRQDMGSLAARIERTEQRQAASPLLPPRPADAGPVIEQVLARVNQRLEQAESSTTNALRSLESSFATLDQRLQAAEQGLDPQIQVRAEARFEQLAAELAQSVEDARAEMAHRISVTADGGRFDELEKSLREVGEHVEAAERRSNEAIERMGREIMRLTEALSARVTNVESESANAVERVTAVVEKRLDRADHTHAEALERLGDEMARLSERLSDRVESSERRSADAIEDVGEKLVSVTEKLQERYERTAENLSERIRASEERAQRLLEETRDKLDRRLGDTQEHFTRKMGESEEQFARKMGESEEQFLRRIGETKQGLSDQFTRKLGEASEQLARRIGESEEQFARRMAESQQGLSDQFTRKIGEANEQFARRIGETEEQFSKRMAETRQGLSDQFARRIGETEEQFSKRIGSAERGFTDQLQDRLAGILARGEHAEPSPAFEDSAFSSTVFTPPADMFDDSDDELEPFGSYAPAVSVPSASDDDGFRRTPMAADTLGDLNYDSPTPTAEPQDGLQAAMAAFEAPEPEPALTGGYTPAFETEPMPVMDMDGADALAEEADAAAAEAAQPFPASMFSDDDFSSDFDADDDFISGASAQPPAVTVAAVAAPAPMLREPIVDPLVEEMAAEPAAEEPLDLDVPPPTPRSSTREMLEAARAAARAAGQKAEAGRKLAPPMGAGLSSSSKPDLGGLKNTGPVAPMSVDPFLKSKGPGLNIGFGLGDLLSKLKIGKKDDKEAQTFRTAMLVAGVSFAFGASGAGYYLINKSAEKDAAGDGVVGPRKAPAGEAGPMAASLVLGTSQNGAVTPGVEPLPGEDAAAMYVTAVRSIEGQDPQAGLSALRRAADLGYAPAQFYLGKLYESGEAGLQKDAAQARRWTERAALGGDRKAMHNLALLYFSGDGGPQNQTTAARWFRRAAQLGLVDSQYNLGRLYEEGFGVTVNPAEAYKWYLIAGRAGDGEARTSAQRLKRQLSAEVQASAERAALAFRSQAAAPAARTAPADPDVAAAQRGLSRLGFYQGPADGVSSPALRRAIAAYQREQGMIPTGSPTADLLAKLSPAG